MPRRLVLGAGALVAGIVAVLAVRIYTAGFGADNDTWLMLGTWDALVERHRYVPSRPPGYAVPEVIIGATSELAGSWSSNLVSVVLGAATLVLLHGLIRRRTSARTSALLLVGVLAVTPAFVIAATTSIDYVYGLFFFVAGWAVLETGRPSWLGGLLLGLAGASRLTYAPLALVVIALGPGRSRPMRERVAALALATAVTIVGYVPAWRSAGDLSFVTAQRPTGQGLVGLLGRAALKGADLLGVLGTVVGIVAVVLVVRAARPGSARTHDRGAGEWWLLVVAGIQLVVWVWIPAEPSYLLPSLVALLAWVARPGLSRAVTGALAALVAVLGLYAVVDLRIVEVDHDNRYGYDTCDATEATGARFRPHVTVGPLLGYPELSRDLRACNTQQRAAFTGG